MAVFYKVLRGWESYKADVLIRLLLVSESLRNLPFTLGKGAPNTPAPSRLTRTAKKELREARCYKGIIPSK